MWHVLIFCPSLHARIHLSIYPPDHLSLLPSYPLPSLPLLIPSFPSTQPHTQPPIHPSVH